MLPPLTDLVDVRSEHCGRFVIGAARIPVDELRQRLHELPDKRCPFKVAATGPEAEVALDFLTKGGREASLERSYHWTRHSTSKRLWQPNEFLEQVVHEIPPGNALDLGCGSGREAVFLASLGWSVVAMDRLPDALERGRGLAAATGVEVQWLLGDIDLAPQSLVSKFNLVFSLFSFSPGLKSVLQFVAPQSSLLIETFSPAHRHAFGKPDQNRCASKEELRMLAGSSECLRLSEDWRPSGRHTSRLWRAKSVAVERVPVLEK